MTSFASSPSSNSKVGRTIFKTALQALLADSEIIGVMLISMAINIGIAVVVGAGWIAMSFFTAASNLGQIVNAVAAIVLALSFGVTHALAQATVIAAANERFEGGNPTIKSAFASTLKRFAPLALFGLLEGTVGLVLRYIAENIKVLGEVVRIFGGLAWGVATYFAIPMIVFEEKSPIEAIKSSSSLIKAKWGNVLRGNVVATAIIVLAMFIAFGAIFGGIVWAFMSGDSSDTFGEIAGSSLALLGVLAILALSLISSAVISYVKVALYRFATGKSVAGFDEGSLAQGFRTRR